jgi:hypothetical protein
MESHWKSPPLDTKYFEVPLPEERAFVFPPILILDQSIRFKLLIVNKYSTSRLQLVNSRVVV